MEVIVFLRGVTPVGKNRIPKMAYLVEILSELGFSDVRSYIQSGNIVLNTTYSRVDTMHYIHNVIRAKIGADVAVIIKTKKEIEKALALNPFDNSFDRSRIHLVLTNQGYDVSKLDGIELRGEVLFAHEDAIYLYLPRDAEKKRLNANFIERKLGVVATMRKIRVVEYLYDWLKE